MKAQALLRQATGLNLSQQVAERAVRQRMERRDCADSDTYLAQLTADELTALVELVVVPESWLFRDIQAFHAATAFVRRRAAVATRPIRILSIPCAGGEEPYSMAMALCDAGVARAAFSIDAVDLSPGCIARARAGVYGNNAFRAADTAFRERYFTPLGDGDYRIADALREQVNFKQGNLLQFDTATYGAHYDLVFCRNLLIYFDQPTTSAAIAVLTALLAEDAMLLVGYAEVPSLCRHGFTVLPHRHAFALTKSAPPAPGLPTVAAAPARKPAPRAASTAGASTPPARAPRPAPPPPAASAIPSSGKAPADLLQQARDLADLAQFQQADEKCQAHLAAHPDSADAYFLLGMLSEQAGAAAPAEHYWRRCLYLQPDHYDALCHLALLAERAGNDSGAATLKARAARIFQRRQAS